MATAAWEHGDRRMGAWRPQGSPLLYDPSTPVSVYRSGDPCGRHAAYGGRHDLRKRLSKYLCYNLTYNSIKLVSYIVNTKVPHLYQKICQMYIRMLYFAHINLNLKCSTHA